MNSMPCFAEFLKTLFQNWYKRSGFLLHMFFTFVYLMWRLFFTIPFGAGSVSVFAGFALLLVEALGMMEAFVHYLNMYTAEEYPFPEEVPEERYPDVDVFVATYTEPVELLQKTLHGCKRMKYPDQSKVHIYLCDDGHREEMRDLAARLGVHYLDREDHAGAKAGNLNHALAHSSSPYVVTFDADMIPRSSFLLRTIPYFVDSEMKNEGLEENERVELGFVQAPQSFYNLDLFQFNLYSEQRIPNEQDYFYKAIQVSRTRTNSVIYGGSNTVISRKALDSIGGFYTDAITEDFATGILIEKKQFVSLATDEPLASGLSPQNLKDLIQQRIRWARGVLSLRHKMKVVFSPDLSLSQRMNYWASMWYWYAPIKRMIYVMAPILYAFFDFMVFQCTLPQVIVFWLPMYIAGNFSLRQLSHNIRDSKWSNIYESLIFPFMLLPVLFEIAGMSLKKFKVTGKDGSRNEKGQNTIYTVPFLILIGMSVVGIIKCILIMLESGSFGPIVVIFWLVYNLYLLVLALFFVDGRSSYRRTERVRVQTPCRVRYRGEEMEGFAVDASEEGFAIRLKQPCYFDRDEKVEILVDSQEYHVDVFATVVYVKQEQEEWQYSFYITDLNDTYEELLTLLYDRVPTVPTELKKDSGTFEDLRLNLQKRQAPPFYERRLQPRVPVREELPCEPGAIQKDISDQAGRERLSGEAALPDHVYVHDFNYTNLTVRIDDAPQCMTVRISDRIRLECDYESRTGNGYVLYHIRNIRAVLEDPSSRQELLELLTAMAKKNSKKYEGAGISRRFKKDEFNEMTLLGEDI